MWTHRHSTLVLICAQSDKRSLESEQFYSVGRRDNRYLQSTLNNQPNPLILSRTRAYGISLSEVGLPGSVLDPRMGLHITALAMAHRYKADVAAIALTSSSAIDIAAYGHSVMDYKDIRLKYAIHGYVPYPEVDSFMNTIVGNHRKYFKEWFLPLVALKEKRDI
jgi:hypothetical protein